MTAVRGLALGPARWTKRPRFDLDALVAGDDEGARLDAALDATRAQLAAAAARVPGAEGEIFAAQALLLDDDAIVAPARAAIAAGEPAARAFRHASDEVAAAFDGVEDAYLRARAIDVRDVADRVLLELLGARGARARGAGDRRRRRAHARRRRRARPGHAPGGSSPPAAARSTTRRSSPGRSASRCSSASAPRCWTSPRAATLAIDDGHGHGRARRGDHAGARAAPRRRRRGPRRSAGAAAEPVMLADGRRIEVFANIGNADDARLAVEQGAEGVGLLRTEFLFHDRATPPSEDEQVAALTEIAERLEGRPLIVRTLDAGRRQAAAVRRPRARGQPVPRQARHPACRWSSPSCSPRSCARSCAWPPSTRCR